MKYKTDEELRLEFPDVDDFDHLKGRIILYGSTALNKVTGAVYTTEDIKAGAFELFGKQRQKQYDAEMYEARKKGEI